MFEFPLFLKQAPILGNNAASFCGRNNVLLDNINNRISLADYLDNPALIHHDIETFDSNMNFPSKFIATTQFHKHFIRQILMPILSYGLLDEGIPTSIKELFIDRNHGNIEGPFWQHCAATKLTAPEFQQVINEFAMEIASVFIDDIVYGKTDTYGNTGLAIADPWMKLAKSDIPRDAIIESYQHFIIGLDINLQSAIQALPVKNETNDEVIFRRRKSCCLKYEIPGKKHCATCSKLTNPL